MALAERYLGVILDCIILKLNLSPTFKGGAAALSILELNTGTFKFRVHLKHSESLE